MQAHDEDVKALHCLAGLCNIPRTSGDLQQILSFPQIYLEGNIIEYKRTILSISTDRFESHDLFNNTAESGFCTDLVNINCDNHPAELMLKRHFFGTFNREINWNLL